jgi:hypothetical protein
MLDRNRKREREEGEENRSNVDEDKTVSSRTLNT